MTICRIMYVIHYNCCCFLFGLFFVWTGGCTLMRTKACYPLGVLKEALAGVEMRVEQV